MEKKHIWIIWKHKPNYHQTLHNDLRSQSSYINWISSNVTRCLLDSSHSYKANPKACNVNSHEFEGTNWPTTCETPGLPVKISNLSPQPWNTWNSNITMATTSPQNRKYRPIWIYLNHLTVHRIKTGCNCPVFPASQHEKPLIPQPCMFNKTNGEKPVVSSVGKPNYIDLHFNLRCYWPIYEYIFEFQASWLSVGWHAAEAPLRRKTWNCATKVLSCHMSCEFSKGVKLEGLHNKPRLCKPFADLASRQTSKRNCSEDAHGSTISRDIPRNQKNEVQK